MTEKHIIKVTAQLKNVRLLVRFPCKLTFQLKSDHAQNDSRNSYELKKGECAVNETLEAEAQLNFDPLTGQYQDKKVRIYVQMASANGVIPAGNVTFNPCNKEPLERVEYTLPLQKCPDRSAQITFYQSFQLLRKKNPDPIYQSQVAITKTRTQLKFSNAAQSQYQNQPRKSPKQQKSSNSRNLRLTPNNYREPSPRAQRINTTASHVQNYPPPRQYQQYQEYQEFGESQVEEEAVGYKRYSSRYLDPSEKAHYVKEIARLKGELKSLQGDERWEQLIRVKQQNEALGGELEKMRERVKLLERREREVNLQLKEAREEGDRNKNKYLQAESLKNEGEVVLAERERTLREQQAELKRFQEKIQDLNVQIVNSQKRVEFKENSYQEQLRKLNEKYSQSQQERQKVTFDYNTLLARLQETEKKHQAAAKDKDRSFAQERNKLNKKIDTLTQTLDRLKEEQSQRDSQLTDLTSQAKIQAKRDVEREERVSALESELDVARQQLKREQDQRKINEKQIADYKIIEEERNTLRKRNNEQAGELAKSAEKLDRANSELSLLDAKARELEVTLGERTREKDALNAKFNSLRKEFDASKREEERLNRQYEALSAQSFNANQKLNEFRSKLDAQKNQTQEMKVFYEEQLAYLAKGKEYAEHEIEEQRWSLEKAQQQYEQLGQRLRAANSDILALNETILISSERAKRAQDQSKQLASTVENLRREIVDWEQKERSLNEQLRGKGESAYEVGKKLQRVESELFVVREKLRQTETSAEERRASDEKSLREKERVLTQRSEEMTGAQLEALSLKEEKASLTQELAIRNNEISYLKDSLQSSKQDVSTREIKLEELREELKLSNQQIEQLTKELEDTKTALEEESRTASKNRKETEQYKTANLKALQQLLEQVGKDEEATSLAKQNLLTFPDQTLSAMQVETFKKRNLILAKYQQTVLDLKEELALAQNQLSKARKALTEREEEFQALQKGEKEKLRLSNAQTESRREQLEKKIEELQEQKLALSGQLQKSANEIKRRDDIAEELRDEIRVAAIEIQALRGELKLAEEKIVGLKSNEIKWKASNESKFSELTGQNQSVLQRYKSTIADLQKKSLSDEKTIREKEEAIKKLQNKINEITYEKEKADVRVLQLHQKWILITEERKDLQKKVKTLQKQNKEINLQLTNSRETLSNQKAKLQQVQQKLNEAYSAGTEAQVQVQRLKGEIESVRGSVREAQQQSKDRAEKLKAAGERWSSEGKQLKQKIIGLSSTVELREFHIGQLQGQLASVRQQLSELKEQLSRRKTEGIRLADQLQQKKNQEMYSSQNIEILKSEKEFLEEENDRLKERVAVLEEEATETQLVIETAQLKDKELAKLKEEIEQTRAEKERMTSQLRVSVSNNPRGSGMLTSRLGGDDKKRIRQLEQLLEVKHVDLAIERKKLLNEFQREKRGIVNQNGELREQVQNLQNEFDFQRAQLNKEIESLNEDITRLSMELAEKNELLVTSEQLLEGVKSEQNSAQIQECIFNIKSIFERSDAAPNHRSEEQYVEEQAVAQQ